MPHQVMRSLTPVVQHAAGEWLYGAAPAHAMWQATLAGYFVGRGLSPQGAIHAAEHMEHMGMVPGFEPAAVERMERAARRQGAQFGFPMPWQA